MRALITKSWGRTIKTPKNENSDFRSESWYGLLAVGFIKVNEQEDAFFLSVLQTECLPSQPIFGF